MCILLCYKSQQMQKNNSTVLRLRSWDPTSWLNLLIKADFSQIRAVSKLAATATAMTSASGVAKDMEIWP